jgi:hypothetical protein
MRQVPDSTGSPGLCQVHFLDPCPKTEKKNQEVGDFPFLISLAYMVLFGQKGKEIGRCFSHSLPSPNSRLQRARHSWWLKNLIQRPKVNEQTTEQ